MSTQPKQETSWRPDVDMRDLAVGIDRWLIRLLQISVGAIMLLALSDTARTHNELMIPIAMVLAAVFALSDIR